MNAPFLTFLGISALVIATPGPDTALTIRNTLLGGRRAGMSTALGVAVGEGIWAVATSVGLVALLLASEPVFQALKLLGAAYLLYLGLQSLRSAFSRASASLDSGAHKARTGLRNARAFRQGVINDLSNPKMAVFFASVLPQFAAQGHGMLSELVGLGIIFASLTFAWLALYAFVIARAGDLARASKVGRTIDGVAGVALVGLGVKVALEDR